MGVYCRWYSHDPYFHDQSSRWGSPTKDLSSIIYFVSLSLSLAHSTLLLFSQVQKFTRSSRSSLSSDGFLFRQWIVFFLYLLARWAQFRSLRSGNASSPRRNVQTTKNQGQKPGEYTRHRRSTQNHTHDDSDQTRRWQTVNHRSSNRKYGEKSLDQNRTSCSCFFLQLSDTLSTPLICTVHSSVLFSFSVFVGWLIICISYLHAF